MVEKKNFFNILYLLGSGFLFVLFFIVAIAAVYFLFGYRGVEDDENSPTYQYEILTINPSKDEKSFGFTSIKKELKEDEFLFYEVENGNHVLISRFEDNKFKCTGKCYCEMSDSRRTAATAITQSLTYLLTAASSVFAYQIARSYFDTECADRMIDSCPENAILSDVEDCEVEKESDPDWVKNQELNYEEKRGDSFLCKGRCIPNSHFRREYELPQSLHKPVLVSMHNFGCDKLEMEEHINFGFDGEIKNRLQSMPDSPSREQFATFAFSYKDLDELCRSRSKEDFSGKKKYWKKDESPTTHTVNLCVGFDYYAAKMGGPTMHASNKCIQEA